MKISTIAILAVLATTASAQEFRAPIGPQKPVRAMPTPPAMLQRPPVEGVIARAFSDSRNPLQMLNPWAPPRYGTWVESQQFDPDHPGKGRGVDLCELLF